MRDSLSIILRNVGYETKLSSSGEEALGYLSEHEVDVVLLDVILPGMNGYEVLTHLRKKRPDTFVLMMTGGTSVQSAVKAIKEGAYDYLSKPIDHEELLIRIGNAISQKRLMTEKMKLETQLNEVQKLELMSVLAGGLAHDFNNVLTVIQGSVSLMLMDIRPDHTQYQRLLDVEKQIEVGASLTRKLLGYVRKEQGQAEFIDVNRHIRDTVDVFHSTRKGVNIHQELHGNLPAVRMAKGQIEQILLNLLINAADAMPDGGEIVVTTSIRNHAAIRGCDFRSEDCDYLLISVSDTGEGMDSETLKRIFDPFFTTKPAGKGTGLGLTSVYSIVRAAGGYIDVKSVKGMGADFDVYLPMTDEPMPAADEQKEVAADPAGTERTVLLVDDDEIILRTGRKLLEAIGYRVYEARDGKSAIQTCKKYGNEIDIVLLDLVMPDMRGDDVYGELAKINPALKVVIVSGYADEKMIEDLLRRGCRGFLMKPFSARELSKLLHEKLRDSKSVIH